MSIIAKFYTFSKMANSTKIPGSGDVAVEYPIELIEPTSFLHPTISLKMNPMSTGDPTNFNYVLIPHWSRYYFVDDIVYDATDGYWNFTMTVDVLGSARTGILNSLQYVERSATSWNLELIDRQYPTDTAPQFFNRKYAPYFNATPNSGLYILGIVSRLANATRFGGLQYWILDSSQMNALVQYMLGVDQYAGQSLTGIAADLLGFIGEPLQFIASCKFLPRTIIDISGMTPEQIYFGVYPATGCMGYKMPDTFVNPSPVIQDGFTIPLDPHPQSGQRGMWLNSNSNTQRSLRFEPWGTIPLDCSKLADYEYIACVIDTDIITGAAILSIYASHTAWFQITDIYSLPLLGTYNTNLLIDIPLSQYRHEGYIKGISDNILVPQLEAGLSTSKGFAGGGYLGAITGAASGIAEQAFSLEDGARSFWGPPRAQGTPGSLLCRTEIIITSCFAILVDEDLAQWGRPLCEHRSLSNLQGFVKCKGASFESNSFTRGEIERIVKFMDSGMYIE